MKAVVAVCAVAVLAGCAASPPPSEEGAAVSISSADSAAIVALNDRLATHGRAGEWNAWLADYIADPVRMPPHGVTATGREANDALNKATPRFAAFESRATLVEGSGDIAVATGTWSAGIPAGKNGAGKATPAMHDEGRFMQVLRKQADGSWKIERDIWNSSLPLPPGKP